MFQCLCYSLRRVVRGAVKFEKGDLAYSPNIALTYSVSLSKCLVWVLVSVLEIRALD